MAGQEIIWMVYDELSFKETKLKDLIYGIKAEFEWKFDVKSGSDESKMREFEEIIMNL